MFSAGVTTQAPPTPKKPPSTPTEKPIATRMRALNCISAMGKYTLNISSIAQFLPSGCYSWCSILWTSMPIIFKMMSVTRAMSKPITPMSAVTMMA